MAQIKLSVLKLTGDLKGKTIVINNRYQFVDGELRVNHSDGQLIKNILVNFYACEYTEELIGEADSDESEATLLASHTKGALGSSVEAAEKAKAEAEKAKSGAK